MTSNHPHFLSRSRIVTFLAPLVMTACATTESYSRPDASLDTATSEANAAMDTFAKQLRRDEIIPSLSIVVARDNAIVFTGNYGFQDHDGEEATTASTSYLAASITKTFTAVTLLAMESDGHISLDEDFTTFSEWDERCESLVRSGSIFGGAKLDGLSIGVLDCDARITLEHVLSHRVNGEPGAEFVYNPVVFGRLSNYIEEKTGRAWRNWVRQYAIDAAELDGIAAGWRDSDGADVLTHFAPPFRHVEPEVDKDRFSPSALPNTELNASSGIIASPTALANYANALMQGKILPIALLERMWTSAPGADGTPEAYALGWWVEEIKGRKVVWHGGWWPDAYAGMLLIVPDEGLVLVALGNTDGLHWGNALKEAEIKKSPLVHKFFELYVETDSP